MEELQFLATPPKKKLCVIFEKVSYFIFFF